MKRICALLIILLCGRTVFSQAGESRDPYAEKLVGSFVDQHGTFIVYSMQEKALNRLGDAAAVAMIRHLGDHPPATAEKLERIFMVIKMAFAVPEAINFDADREPKATLLLLSYINYLPASGSIREDVERTRIYVQRQVNDYKAKHAKQ